MEAIYFCNADCNESSEEDQEVHIFDPSQTVVEESNSCSAAAGANEKKLWNYNDTLILISMVAKHFEEMNHPKDRKIMYNKVANDMISQNIEVDASSCHKKWNNLVRTYKVCKENKNNGGRGPIKFKFYMQMDEILGHKPNYSSPHSINTTTINTLSTVIDVASNSSTSEEIEELQNGVLLTVVEADEDAQLAVQEKDPLEEPPRKKKKVKLQSFQEKFMRQKKIEWDLRRKEKQEQHDARLKMMEKKMELEERKLKLLEEFLNFKKSQ